MKSVFYHKNKNRHGGGAQVVEPLLAAEALSSVRSAAEGTVKQEYKNKNRSRKCFLTSQTLVLLKIMSNCFAVAKGKAVINSFFYSLPMSED
jgi:hypothetical protein